MLRRQSSAQPCNLAMDTRLLRYHEKRRLLQIFRDGHIAWVHCRISDRPFIKLSDATYYTKLVAAEPVTWRCLDEHRARRHEAFEAP